MGREQLRWPADETLNGLIRRYYAGEGGLWETIRQHVDDELRRREIKRGHYHLRLLGQGDGRYDILIQDATDFALDP